MRLMRRGFVHVLTPSMSRTDADSLPTIPPLPRLVRGTGPHIQRDHHGTEILSDEELADLTGYKARGYQRRWLEERGWGLR